MPVQIFHLYDMISKLIIWKVATPVGCILLNRDNVRDYPFDMVSTACFTGHRLTSLPKEYSHPLRVRMMQSLIALRVIEAARAGYRTFITGMALGADMLFADSVLDHADANPELGIRLVGVSPFAGEERRLSPEELTRYNSVKDRCHAFITLSSGYYNGCFAARNRFMVEHSSLLIALYHHDRSGTSQTINMAKRKGLRIEQINLGSLSVYFGL